MATKGGPPKIVGDGLIFYFDELNTKNTISSVTYSNIVDNNNFISINNGVVKNSPPTYQIENGEYNYLSEQTSASFSYVSTKDAYQTSLTENIFTDVTAETDPCSGAVNFLDALDWAHSLGGRLPTRQEVADLVVKGTGCGYDAELIWTCDKWEDDDNYHWLVYGDPTRNLGPGVTASNDTLAYVRMVADVDRERLDPIYLNDSVIYNHLYQNYTNELVRTVTYQRGLSNTFEFDGVDDYIGLNKSFIEEIGTGDVSYSLEAWIYYVGTPGTGTSGYSIVGNAGSYGVGLQLFFTTPSVKVNFGYRSNNNVYSNSLLEEKKWYHVIGVREAGVGLRIYINGELDMTTNSAELDVTNTTGEMQIGYSAGRIGYFKGRISMVKIYNRALTDSEANQNYLTGRSRFLDKIIQL